MDRKLLKQGAKDCLSANKNLYLLTLIYLVIVIIASFIPIINSFSFIISLFLTFFLTIIALNAAKGYDGNLDIRTDKLGRYLLSYLAEIGIMFIPAFMYVFGLAFVIIGGTVNFKHISSIPSAEGAALSTFSGVSAMIGIIVFLIGFTVLMILSYMLFPVLYLAVDDEFKGGAGTCITTGINLMKGHKFELFVLQLSFIPWIFFASITLGIGLIYVMPYMQLTYTNFYLGLMNEQNMYKYNAEEIYTDQYTKE